MKVKVISKVTNELEMKCFGRDTKDTVIEESTPIKIQVTDKYIILTYENGLSKWYKKDAVEIIVEA